MQDCPETPKTPKNDHFLTYSADCESPPRADGDRVEKGGGCAVNPPLIRGGTPPPGGVFGVLANQREIT